MTNLPELLQTAELLESLESKKVRLDRAIAATRSKIGRQLERERRHRRITLNQVSIVAETAASSIYRVETGRCKVSNTRIVEIARALAWIIQNEPKPQQNQNS